MRRLKGSIQRKGRDRWRVFATVRDADGVSRRLTRSVQGTREDAEKALAELQGTSHPGMTLGDAIDLYLGHCEARVSAGDMAESTLKGYRSKVEQSIRPRIGRVELSALSAADLNRFIDSLGKDRRGTFAVLRGILNWAWRNGYLEEELSRRMQPVKSPKPAVGPEDVYTADECAAILNHPMDDRLKTAVVLALSCGLRRGEVCGLEWRDYDGERIEVRRAWGKDRPKTEASAAALPVPQWAREWLDARAGEPSEKVCGLSPAMVTDGWQKLFFRWRTRPYRQEPREDAPARYLPFKNLRHTSLTMVYESTGDIKLASRRGRHTTSAITERFYVRPSKGMDERAADALEDALGAKVRTLSHTSGQEERPDTC